MLRVGGPAVRRPVEPHRLPRPLAAGDRGRPARPDAGRLAGSAKNRQPWRFVVVENSDARASLADAVYEPGNVRGAKLVVAIVAKGSLDTGRAVQNMLLVAWNEGVGACPNGFSDPDAAKAALGLTERLRPHVEYYFTLLKTKRALPLPPDQTLIASARKTLMCVPVQKRYYDLFVTSLIEETYGDNETKQYPPLNLAEIFGGRQDVLDKMTSAQFQKNKAWKQVGL